MLSPAACLEHAMPAGRTECACWCRLQCLSYCPSSQSMTSLQCSCALLAVQVVLDCTFASMQPPATRGVLLAEFLAAQLTPSFPTGCGH